jgi:hypothetical protein
MGSMRDELRAPMGLTPKTRLARVGLTSQTTNEPANMPIAIAESQLMTIAILIDIQSELDYRWG